jgi:ATP-dependent Zn protease
MTTGNNWVDTFVAWFPMLLLIGAWIFFMRRYNHPKKGISQWEYFEQFLVEQRRSNEQLEKILSKLTDDRRS